MLWKVGDRCRGISKDDGEYYNCTILSFESDNSGFKCAKVLFEGNSTKASIVLTDLRSIDDASTYLYSKVQLDKVLVPVKDGITASGDALGLVKTTSEAIVGELNSDASTVIKFGVSILSTGSETTAKVWKEGFTFLN